MYLKLERYLFILIVILICNTSVFSQVEKPDSMFINHNDTVGMVTTDSVIYLGGDTVSNFREKNIADTIGVEIVDSNTIKIKSSGKKKSIDVPFSYNGVDSTAFDIKNQTVYLYGDAYVIYGDIRLEAEYISVNMQTKIIEAYGISDSSGSINGKPKFKDKTEEFNADTIRYCLSSKKGIIKGVITEQGGGYLHSAKTKKMPNNEICIKNGKYTTCDLEHPHFYLKLSKAKVIPDKEIVAGPSYLVIEDVPLPIGLPFGLFPDQNKNASGIIIPSYGEEERRGFFLRDGGYYFHISDYVDTKVLFDIYTNGSWGIKDITNYKKRYRYSGNFKLDYSELYVGEPFETTYTKSSAYWIKWKHVQDQKARPNSSFSANVNMGSSKYKAYNMTNDNDRLSGSLSSSVNYRLKFPNSPFNLNVNAAQSQNNTSEFSGYMDVTLPQLTFSMSRIYPLKRKNRVGKARWYEKIGVSYNNNFKNIVTQVHEDTIFTPEGMNQFRNGIIQKIPVSTSMKLLKYFNLSPRFDYTERWYFKSINRSFQEIVTTPTDTLYNQFTVDTLNNFSRAWDYRISLPVSTEIFGMYQFIGKDPAIQAIRHKMTPTVSFDWRPDFGDTKYGYYQYFTMHDGTEKKYSIYDGGTGAWKGIYGTPPSGKYGRIALSLNNNLEMKVRNRKDSVKTNKKVSLLNSLNFSTAYNMALDSLNWSDVNVRANTNIMKIFRVNFNTRLTLYDNDTTGHLYNAFLYDSKNQMFRLVSWNLSLGATLNSKGLSPGKNKRKITRADEEISNATGVPIDAFYIYSDFSMPWSLSVDYSLIMNSHKFIVNTQEWEKNLTQTLRFQGNLSLTKNWKFRFTSGYDLEKSEFTYTSLTFIRDLHCWQMSLNLIPFGTYKSYNFKINVKAAMLKDLALPMRRNWIDNFDFDR